MQEMFSVNNVTGTKKPRKIKTEKGLVHTDTVHIVVKLSCRQWDKFLQVDCSNQFLQWIGLYEESQINHYKCNKVTVDIA